MKLVPLGDRVVLNSSRKDQIRYYFLAGQAKEKPQEAEVIAVGLCGAVDGKEYNGKAVGQKVIYSKYAVI